MPQQMPEDKESAQKISDFLKRQQKELEAVERALRKQQAQRKKLTVKYATGTLAALVVGMATIIASLISNWSTFKHDNTGLVTLFNRTNDLQAMDEALSSNLAVLRAELAARMSNFNASHTNAADIQIQLLLAQQAKSDAQVQQIDKRLTAMEAAVLSSPEKSLAIPLLRKDLDDSGKRLDEYNLSVKAEMDRLYEQQKWMLGGIGAVLLAIAGGCITIILKSLPGAKDVDLKVKVPGGESD